MCGLVKVPGGQFMARGYEEMARRIRENEDGTYCRSELPGRYMAKLLYSWDNRRFEREYLEKLERSWKR